MLRFWKVSFQTVAAPVLTAVLYLLIFGHVLEGRVTVFGAVGYTSFLIPGLVMMSVLQNAFANIELVADPEQDHRQPGVPAGRAAVALGLVRWPTWAPRSCAASRSALGVLRGDDLVRAAARSPSRSGSSSSRCSGAALMGALGLIAGLWAEKFDQIAAFQNFIIMPMTFLSGRLLLGALAAAGLAGGEPPEPVLLHDRRLPPRLLRHQRRLALAQPGGGGRQPGGGLRRCACTCLQIGYKIRH